MHNMPQFHIEHLSVWKASVALLTWKYGSVGNTQKKGLITVFSYLKTVAYIKRAVCSAVSRSSGSVSKAL